MAIYLRAIVCGERGHANALIWSIVREMHIPPGGGLSETESPAHRGASACLLDGSIDLSTTDDPDERDLRRRQLAKRLMSHQARTRTVAHFTGHSRNHLETLRRRWGVATNERHRGPSPTSFAEFFRNARTLQAATAAAVLFEILQTGRRPDSDPSPVSRRLQSGEQLCYVYEALQACFPHMELEFEHMVLLANGLTRGEELRLAHCAQCGSALLVDVLAARQPACKSCCREPVFSSCSDRTNRSGKRR